MNSIIKYATLLAIVFPLLFMTSCKEDDNEDDTSTVNLMLEFDNLIGEHSATSNMVHVVDGDTFDLSLIRYYVSKIKLYDMEGAEIASYPDTYLLVKGEEANTVSLGTLPVGQHVHKIAFNVGIDEATNNQTEEDFNSFPADDPRAIQSPAMHWSWSSGYIFVKLEGTINGNDVELHVGGDNLLKQAEVMIHENTTAGEMFHIKLDADITQFFDGLDKNQDMVTHTMDNMPTAMTVMNNVSKVFSKSGGHGKK